MQPLSVAQSKCVTLEFTINLSDLRDIGPQLSLIPQHIREQLSSNLDQAETARVIREVTFRVSSPLKEVAVQSWQIRGAHTKEISVAGLSRMSIRMVMEWLQKLTENQIVTDPVHITLSLQKDTDTSEAKLRLLYRLTG